MGEKAMSFLNNKSFHPGNAANRYKLFEAEEKKKAEEKKTAELSREWDAMEARRQCKSQIGRASWGGRGESSGVAG